MTKISPLSFSELVRKLKFLDFKGPYAGGKHLYMLKNELRLTLPNPHRKEIGVDLIKRLMRQGGITKKEWGEE